MITVPNCKGENFRRCRPAPAARRGALIAFVALGLGGCSMPLPSFFGDDVTGSIKPRSASLASAYDSSDWGVAKPVLAASLRPSAPAEPSAWSNATTGHRGEFLPVAGTFARDGRSCRVFIAASSPMKARCCRGSAARATTARSRCTTSRRGPGSERHLRRPRRRPT